MEYFQEAADYQEVAQKLFEKAFSSQQAGDVNRALNLYQRSVEMHPTAEAYTYMGWAYSFSGKYEQAIKCCLKAIEVDPDFGNPYNDVGAYLIELGRPYEAITWLRRATRAPRYECRHYPYYNLGKVYEMAGQMDRARDNYAMALRLSGGYPLAINALFRVLAALN